MSSFRYQRLLDTKCTSRELTREVIYHISYTEVKSYIHRISFSEIMVLDKEVAILNMN